MDDTILTKKQKEDQKEKTGKKYKKWFLALLAILFFSGIAILSVILERPGGQWTMVSSDSMETASVMAASGADSSSFVSSAWSSSSVKTGISGPESTFPVYIVGEIYSPGIYHIEPGTFLYQLVEMAGGLTDNAAKSRINLALKITKNQMIKIPSIEEIRNGEIGGTAQGLLLETENGLEDNEDQQAASGKININSANESELDRLPGIGAATAKLIIDYRNKNGNFKTIEDIMKVPGIKQNKFTQIKDQITV